MRQNDHVDREQRRWWRLFDDLPKSLGQVHRWRDGPTPPPAGAGGLHPNPTSVVCLAGVLRIRRGRAALDLQAGQALLIAGGVWHEHETVRPATVWFGQGFFATCSDVIIGGDGRRWSGRLPAEPSRQLMDGALDCADPDRRRHLFTQLITQVAAESVTDLTFAEGPLRRMVDRLWSGLHRGVTVADLIDVSGLSRAQAYRVFTHGYGLPPKEAIELGRLWLADSLRNAGSDAAMAASRSGFPSRATYRRALCRNHLKHRHL